MCSFPVRSNRNARRLVWLEPLTDQEGADTSNDLEHQFRLSVTFSEQLTTTLT